MEVIAPPPISKKTIELGVKYSPEFACFPLKINVGNYIEALENGADTIVMAGGWGPCRFGYYAQVEREILNDLGYDFQMIVLEAPDSKISELLGQVKNLGENVSVKESWMAIKLAWDKLNAVEVLEKKLEYYLPRVYDKDGIERLYEDSLKELQFENHKKDMWQRVHQTEQKMEKMERLKEEPLHIGLVGEIYTVLEPAANYNICRILGRLNVQVHRSIYISQWVNDHLLGGFLKKSDKKKIIQSAKPYLNYWVGGHGRETVGCTVDFARKGLDGIIQIGPLTCMPEIVAQSILPVVSEKEGIPCMTLWFDELAGTAGMVTRVEAFVDMIRRRQIKGLLKEAHA